jgi:hypothetical protein
MTGAALAKLAVCAMLGLALCASACGRGDSSASGKGAGTQAKRGAAIAPPGERCNPRLRRFVGALDSLRDAVAVGVTYDAYLSQVRQLRASYDRVPVGKLAVGCLLAVGGSAERALNAYVEAANAWGNCLADTGCRIESIEPELRRGWDRASSLLSQAQAGRAM